MSERKINIYDAAIFRTQALTEQLLRINVEIYAHLAKKDFQDIFDHVIKEVDVSTKELIKMHSHLDGDSTMN